MKRVKSARLRRRPLHKTERWHDRISRHDAVVLEAAGGDDEKHDAHEEEGDGIDPEVHPPCAAEDDAAGDVDEIGGGDEIAEDEEEFGHGFAREDVAGEKDAGKDGEKGELHGFCL